MKNLIYLFFIFSSCTFSLNSIRTEGTASDVLDETQTASPKLDVSVPVKPI